MDPVGQAAARAQAQAQADAQRRAADRAAAQADVRAAKQQARRADEQARTAIQIPEIPLVNIAGIPPADVELPIRDGAQLSILDFNNIFKYIIGNIFPNIDQDTYNKLKNEFKQLNDSSKHELLKGIINPDGSVTREFIELIEADRNINTWGTNNGYQNDTPWKNLVEELGVIQLHSLVKYNITDLFKAIANKLSKLNKIIEMDRNVLGPVGQDGLPGPAGSTRGSNYEKKYLKYKQKYLKLKNNN
jgi:hypothetical protein